MTPPLAASVLTILVLALVHVSSGMAAVASRRWTVGMLSAAAGVSVGYLFVDLLPDLAARQVTVEAVGILPELERHVYLMALLGLVIALWVETSSRASRRRSRAAGGPDRTDIAVFGFSMAACLVLNASIGYAVATPGDAAVEPPAMFIAAMGLHFLVNDHWLVDHHGRRYRRWGRWLLVAGLLAGWLVGLVPSLEVPPSVLALTLAYIAGGTIMNVLRNELPSTERATNVWTFALGAFVYAAMLLSLTERG